ncbi:hypothetical protein K458DRAFT_414328 [Lentithecium fluviatile CBS 122367]|uniref:Uncharacterized protein n=1 Tax=Lentithecium fluviatile CBS 122367 TaxID=1168545 RepID=A0A6G1JDI5_9PLEO|nr:hypothetical protein K458DRAFT_414328 [Lentithecium fluviatile CBS 122367]
MMPKTLFAFATLPLLGAVAQNSTETFQENVGGYEFIKTGPKKLAPKADYEWAAAQTALKLLKDGLKAQGKDAILKVLSPAIAEADTFWKDIVATSTGKLEQKEGWVSADGEGIAFLPNVTAERFVKWYLSPLADVANNAANPEHYYKATTTSGTAAVSEIIEGWGGITTHFQVPNFALPPNRERYPFLHEHADFPLQAAGDKVLMDGTVFGVLHISARNVKGADYGQPIDGVHVAASVWYGDAAKDDHLEDERTHMTTEIINLTLQAQKDIEGGKLPV